MINRIKLIVTTIIMLTLVGLMLLLINPSDPNNTEDPAADAPTETVFCEYSIDDIEAVEIVNEYNNYSITQKNDEWQVKELGSIKSTTLAQYTVESVVELSSDTIISENTTNLQQFGLDKPGITVRMTFKNGQQLQYNIGNKVPGAADDQTRYFTINGLTVYSVEGVKLSNFTRRITEYVPKVITQPSDEEILYKKVVLSGTSRPKMIIIEPNPKQPDSEQEVTLGNYSSYVITSPKKQDFDDTRKGKFVHELQGLTALDTILINPTDEQLSEYGLKEAWSTLAFTIGSSTTVISLGNQDANGDYYARVIGMPVIYLLSQNDVTFADVSYHDVINLVRLTPSIDTVESIDVKTRNGEYTFNLSGEGSQLVVKHNNSTLDTELFRNLYKVFITARGEYPVTETITPEIDTEIASVRYNYRNEEKESDELQLYPAPNRQYYISINGEIDFTLRELYINKLDEAVEKCIAGEEFTTTW